MNVYRSSLLSLLAAYGGALPSAAHEADAKSAQTAVQSFYSWYAPRAAAANDEPAWAIVVRDRPNFLSTRLRRELREDLGKKSHASGTIEGIDFDPFLGGQDACPHFNIGKATLVESGYLVNVDFACPSMLHQLPVTVSLVRAKSRLVIDDVIFHGGSTLRQALKAR